MLEIIHNGDDKYLLKKDCTSFLVIYKFLHFVEELNFYFVLQMKLVRI